MAVVLALPVVLAVPTAYAALALHRRCRGWTERALAADAGVDGTADDRQRDAGRAGGGGASGGGAGPLVAGLAGAGTFATTLAAAFAVAPRVRTPVVDSASAFMRSSRPQHYMLALLCGAGASGAGWAFGERRR